MWKTVLKTTALLHFIKIFNYFVELLLYLELVISSSLQILAIFSRFPVTAPSFSLTWHITVRTGRHIARRAATGLRRHTSCHRVQDQHYGIDKGWVWTDQPKKRTNVNLNDPLLACIISEPKTKKRPHSHVQHVRVCELHKEIFVLEDPWTGAKVWGEMLLFAYLHDVMRWHHGTY